MKDKQIPKYGENRPLTIRLDGKYWDVLWNMAHLQGREDIDQYATERLQQIIIEDSQDVEWLGTLLADGFKDSLKEDPYYKQVTGQKGAP